VVSPGDTGRALASRLRGLREAHWPDVKITQAELAQALGDRKPASVPLISSWESHSAPKAPPADRLSSYATFFSTHRSVDQRPYRLLDEHELTTEEAEIREGLRKELLDLRDAALSGAPMREPAPVLPATSIVGRGPWHFPGNAPVIIVCPELPQRVRDRMPFASETDPDYTDLSRLTDTGSLLELHGHIRAVNPDLDVAYRSANPETAGTLTSDDSTAHLVLLGGVDWNKATLDAMRLTHIPVTQHSDDNDPNRGWFEVTDGEERTTFAPRFEERESGRVLIEDVGHFVRAPNPLNPDLTVTVCNGMYGRGVFGAVRTLTDRKFRQRNTTYLADRFSDRDTYSLLFRVQIFNGVVVTPVWSAPDCVLHEWSGARP
jgi:hypothetical protein